MSADLWDRSDRYLTGILGLPDPVLRAAQERADAAGLPQIQVSMVQGNFLMTLARAIGARRVLEVGTLAGFSAIWLARALPDDGTLITLEIDPRHAKVARANLAAAGFADRVTVILGPALDTLARLVDEQSEPFDFVFIDANKDSTPAYVEQALLLSRPGTVIVVDNIVRGGSVSDPNRDDADSRGIRQFLRQAAGDPRLTLAPLQIVGSKSYDGLAMVLVNQL